MIEETERVTLEDMEEEEEPQLFDGILRLRKPCPHELKLILLVSIEPVDPGIAVTDASGSGSTPEPNQVDLFLASLPSMMNKKFVDTVGVVIFNPLPPLKIVCLLYYPPVCNKFLSEHEHQAE